MDFLENYEKYKELTEAKNWAGINELSKIKFDAYGTKKEFNVLKDYISKDEVVFATASGIMKQTSTSSSSDKGSNTWLVVLTSERFLFLDHAFLTKAVDTQSVRHKNIQAVSASQGFMFGQIQIDLGARVISIDNCNKDAVKKIAELSNQWLAELQNLETKSNSHSDGSMEVFLENQLKIITLLEDIKNKIQ